MPKIIFNPSEVAKSADINHNFANTWNGQYMDDQSIAFRHLSPEARGVTGGIIAFSGPVASIPTGWFLCDGQSLSRSVQSALFNVIGTRYGAQDTSTFQVPNLLGRTIVQIDANQAEFNALGKTSGEKSIILTIGQMPNHAHGVHDPGHAHGVHDPGHTHLLHGSNNDVVTNEGRVEWSQGIDTRGGGVGGAGTGIGIHGAASNIGIHAAGGNQAHNNIQPSMALNYLIKA